jgi:hypothetical protein
MLALGLIFLKYVSDTLMVRHEELARLARLFLHLDKFLSTCSQS